MHIISGRVVEEIGYEQSFHSLFGNPDCQNTEPNQFPNQSLQALNLKLQILNFKSWYSLPKHWSGIWVFLVKSQEMFFIRHALQTPTYSDIESLLPAQRNSYSKTVFFKLLSESCSLFMIPQNRIFPHLWWATWYWACSQADSSELVHMSGPSPKIWRSWKQQQRRSIEAEVFAKHLRNF